LATGNLGYVVMLAHPIRPLLSREKAHIRSNINAQREQDWTTSAKCGHLRKIDGTLPASYIRKLYGSLPRNRADLLTQLRTGHSWLCTYAKAFGFRDNDACQHMLVSPRLEVSLAGSFGLPYAEFASSTRCKEEDIS
jgi:hypothetical protein